MKWKIKHVWNHQPDTYCGWYSTQNTTVENISGIQYRSHTTKTWSKALFSMGRWRIFSGPISQGVPIISYKFHGSLESSWKFTSRIQSSNPSRCWLVAGTHCWVPTMYSSGVIFDLAFMELASWSMALMTELFQRCLWINHTFKPLGKEPCTHLW